MEVATQIKLNSNSVTTGAEFFENVSNFSYLGDITGEFGGCVDALYVESLCIASTWKAF